MQMLAFQAARTLDEFDLSKKVFRGGKIRVLGAWGVGVGGLKGAL